MEILIGLIVALFVGLTGIGAGSFTAPALILLVGLSGAESVGTTLVFSTIVRLIAAPFYIAGKHIHLRNLGFMLLGAVPGLVGGTFALTTFNSRRWNPAVLIGIGIGIGITLVISSVLSFCFGNRAP